MASKLIVIAGLTGSGKSALGLKLAKKFNGEIICADSWTVRKEVNIGTAKPSLTDQKSVPHHLLDIVEPCGDFTAAVFKGLANQAITDITARGRTPIMVGGTGLYIDGILYDYGFLPHTDRADREKFNELSIKELRDIIASKGLDDSKVDVRNKRRLIRLIETNGAKPTKKTLRPNTLILGIQISKDRLKANVIGRVDSMIANGLEQEARQLITKYGPNCEALKGIGYKEWLKFIELEQTLDQTKDRIVSNTLALAKRQKTWFKRNKSIHWIAHYNEAEEIVLNYLNKNNI